MRAPPVLAIERRTPSSAARVFSGPDLGRERRPIGGQAVIRYLGEKRLQIVRGIGGQLFRGRRKVRQIGICLFFDCG
jgi:hypothetical protein